MQQVMDLVVGIGGFAALVIVVCVVVMLLISFVERDRRSNDPPGSGKRKG